MKKRVDIQASYINTWFSCFTVSNNVTTDPNQQLQGAQQFIQIQGGQLAVSRGVRVLIHPFLYSCKPDI